MAIRTFAIVPHVSEALFVFLIQKYLLYLLRRMHHAGDNGLHKGV